MCVKLVTKVIFFFFTVNVMLTAAVNIIEKFGKEGKENRLKIGKIGIN